MTPQDLLTVVSCLFVSLNLVVKKQDRLSSDDSSMKVMFVQVLLHNRTVEPHGRTFQNFLKVFLVQQGF